MRMELLPPMIAWNDTAGDYGGPAIGPGSGFPFLNRIDGKRSWPYEIVRVCDGQTMIIREMAVEIDPAFKPRRVGELCVNEDDQSWTCEVDKKAPKFRVMMFKDGWTDDDGYLYVKSAVPIRLETFDLHELKPPKPTPKVKAPGTGKPRGRPTKKAVREERYRKELSRRMLRKMGLV